MWNKQLTIALLIATTNLQAQALPPIRLLGGAIAANQSWRYSGPEWKTENRWSVAGAVSVEAVEFPFASLLLGIQYSQKGMTQRIPLTTASDPEGLSGRYLTVSPRIDYLSFPLLAKVSLPLPSFKPYFLAGGRVDVRVGKRGDGFDSIIEQFRKSELGVSGGIGVEYPLPALFDMIVEFRYDASLQYSFSNEFLKVRNRAFLIWAGVKL